LLEKEQAAETREAESPSPPFFYAQIPLSSPFTKGGGKGDFLTQQHKYTLIPSGAAEPPRAEQLERTVLSSLRKINGQGIAIKPDSG
jgi:hypothetical protein